MDFVYSQSPWVLPKDPEGTEKIFSDHGWKVTFNDHEVIPFGLEKTGLFHQKRTFRHAGRRRRGLQPYGRAFSGGHYARSHPRYLTARQ